MPICPFCKDTQEFMSDQEMINHIITEHPEKTASAEAYASEMGKVLLINQKYIIAATLISIQFSGREIDPEVIMTAYKWYLKELDLVFRMM